ncbi:putative inorganic phosphate cotransporter [Colias croceus]|uniref:putative inorganic phosphate cotransporter n=1 Tax=Colias crocea TaxID=72248 RepID=UPI001E27D8A4|nr:putative inorganic phosphate cotransporter [Colias croceus]
MTEKSKDLNEIPDETLLNIKVFPIPNRDSALIKCLRNKCCIPQRWIFGVLAHIGLCNAYTMRVAHNLAITQMVNRTKSQSHHFDPDACPNEAILNLTTFVRKPYATFDWDEETQGFILSGFYYGYILTQFIGGYLAEKFDGKWTLGIGLLITAILTFLTPIVIRTGGPSWLFALRVLQGITEGPTIPGIMLMMSRWTPPHERALQGALIFGGPQTGNIFGAFMSGILLADGRDWANVFYFFGAFGLVWFILWTFLCYNEANQHPFISHEELEHLNKVIPRADETSRKDPVPWKAILRSPAAWALLFAGVGHDWGFYTMVSDLPKYMHDVLKFNIATTGALTCLPYVAKWGLSFLFGFTCDYGIKKKWHSIRIGRIIYTTIGTALPATCIILASYSGCNRAAAITCFILAMGFMGAYVSGMKVNTLDVAPNYAGSVTAFINTFTTFCGIISPYLIGLLTPDSTLVQWRRAFWICFFIMMISNIAYTLLAKGKQQWWDDVRKLGYPSDWKHGPIIKEVVDKAESDKLCEKEERISIEKQ